MIVKDPLLKQISANIEKSVRKEDTTDYHRIMAAGKKLMFSNQTFKFMQEYMGGIKAPADIPKIVSHGIVKLISIIFNESKGTMSLSAAGPAAMQLMVDALDYVEQVQKIEVDKPVIDQTTLLTKDGLVKFIKEASKISDEDWAKVTEGKGAMMPGAEQAPPAGLADTAAPTTEPAPQTAPAGMVQG
jgi:hypothetical protein